MVGWNQAPSSVPNTGYVAGSCLRLTNRGIQKAIPSNAEVTVGFHLRLAWIP